MNYLLDTCVISELVARQPNQRVLARVDSIEETHLYLSAITIGEIRKGIEKLPDSRRRSDLEGWLQDRLLPRFQDRILPINTAVMLRWGQTMGALEKQGKTIPAIDSLIAATALQSGMTLVTRNEADFVDTGVDMVNPWL